MITVEGVTRQYGTFTAVDNVSFTAQTGRVTGFLGPNGAGKSTTMRIMVGLTRATSGTVTISGHQYVDRWRSPWTARTIDVPQRRHGWPPRM